MEVHEALYRQAGKKFRLKISLSAEMRTRAVLVYLEMNENTRCPLVLCRLLAAGLFLLVQVVFLLVSSFPPFPLPFALVGVFSTVDKTAPV